MVALFFEERSELGQRLDQRGGPRTAFRGCRPNVLADASRLVDNGPFARRLGDSLDRPEAEEEDADHRLHDGASYARSHAAPTLGAAPNGAASRVSLLQPRAG
jgi:hypothetical protein